MATLRKGTHPPFTSPPQRFFHHAVSLSVLVLTDAQKTTTLRQKRAMEASEFHAFHTNYVPWGSRASASRLRHFLPSTKYSKYPKHLFIYKNVHHKNISIFYFSILIFPPPLISVWANFSEIVVLVLEFVNTWISESKNNSVCSQLYHLAEKEKKKTSLMNRS